MVSLLHFYVIKCHFVRVCVRVFSETIARTIMKLGGTIFGTSLLKFHGEDLFFLRFSREIVQSISYVVNVIKKVHHPCLYP